MSDSGREPDRCSIPVREYGASGPLVIALHGGPGAAGSMAAVARGLADSFRVLEPFQRGSGEDPLTVARHVADLHAVMESRAAGTRPALVGHSWGAMLALAYAASHPQAASRLVLIGCGTFDRAARERLESIRAERMNPERRRRLVQLERDVRDPDLRMRRFGELFLEVDSCDPVSTDAGVEVCDARANAETWSDMLRLQQQGLYPAAFGAIDVPVLMLHGTFDPHPGELIHRSLAPHLRRLEYVALDRCGHYPWLEKVAREEFFQVLRGWLGRGGHAAR